MLYPTANEQTGSFKLIARAHMSECNNHFLNLLVIITTVSVPPVLAAAIPAGVALEGAARLAPKLVPLASYEATREKVYTPFKHERIRLVWSLTPASYHEHDRPANLCSYAGGGPINGQGGSSSLEVSGASAGQLGPSCDQM